jgi:hypothetical protein
MAMKQKQKQQKKNLMCRQLFFVCAVVMPNLVMGAGVGNTQAKPNLNKEAFVREKISAIDDPAGIQHIL